MIARIFVGVGVGVHVLLLCSDSAFAQGKSQEHKKSAPPSRNELAARAIAAPAPSGATPLAWIDDASLIGSGMIAVSVSAARWQGGDASELDVPIVDAVFGLTPRVQLSMSVPRVVGSTDPGGAVGGVGTSFFSSKIGVYDGPGSSLKIAIAPTLQVLGKGIVDALGPDEGRVRWGVPVSAEIGGGPVRLYGGGGYFSPGLWFTGAAVSARATDRLFISTGFSRAWRSSDVPGEPLSNRDRKELSGGAGYVVTPVVTVFGSIGRTIATLDQNGAGTSVAGGVSLAFVTAGR